jgi:hypothetical protein
VTGSGYRDRLRGSEQLRRTGLVDPYRVGKQVFYQPSDLATLLIGNLLAISVESGLFAWSAVHR